MGGSVQVHKDLSMDDRMDEFLSSYAILEKTVEEQEKLLPTSPEATASHSLQHLTMISPRLLQRRSSIYDVEMEEEINEFKFSKKAVPLHKLIKEKVEQTKISIKNKYQFLTTRTNRRQMRRMPLQ